MKKDKNNILIIASALGAMIAFLSASLTLCMFENKTDFCYVMKRKAKKAIKQMEDKLEM